MPVHAHIPASHRWMTVEEAAKHFGVVPMRVRAWIMDGNIAVDPKRGVLLADLLKQRAVEAQRRAAAPPVREAAAAPVIPVVVIEPPAASSTPTKVTWTGPLAKYADDDVGFFAGIGSNNSNSNTGDKAATTGLFVVYWLFRLARFLVVTLAHITVRVISLLIGFTIGFLLVRRR